MAIKFSSGMEENQNPPANSYIMVDTDESKEPQKVRIGKLPIPEKVQDAVDKEVQRATKVETQLSSEIALKASQTDLDAERKKRSEDDQALSVKIDVEEKRAQLEEKRLSDQVTALEKETEYLGEFTSLQEQRIYENSDLIRKETSRAIVTEQELSDRIETESDRATDAEKKLSDQVTALEKETEYLGEFTSLQEQRIYENSDLIRKETSRAIVTEQELSDMISAAKSEIGAEVERAVEAERSLALLIGAKANRENTYTKSDVDRIIEKTLSGGSCSCCGDSAILINLNASNNELWEKLSSNINSRFNGYLTMGEEIFNLHVTWNPLGEKVEISRTEGMRVEFILLEKNADGSITRSEEFTEYIY